MYVHLLRFGVELRSRRSFQLFHLSRLRLYIEGCIGVIDAIHPLPGMEHLGTKPLMKRIPTFYSNERLATKEQGQNLALPTEIGHLSMNKFILNQAADLTIHHPVELSDQDDVIAQFTMLREET